MPRPMLIIASLVVGLLVAIGMSTAEAAPKAILWERWTAHDPASQETIDHGAWGDILDRYLVTGGDGINLFAYGEVTSDDASGLDRYIESLAQLQISGYDRPEQMAYWINLYNALTVKVILDHYAVESIRDIDISPGLFSDGPWGSKLLMIEGEKVSLDDIEHQILRPIFRDPRIHYAVNCASIGCPNLQPEPFDPGRLDRQLDLAAREFVNHRRAVDIQGEEIRASSIYSWFKDDFGGNDQGVIAHLKAYADPELAMKLEDFDSLNDHGYDWRLNDAASPTRS